MAWFNPYRKWDPTLGIFVFDEAQKTRDDILEAEWRNNRGKSVRAYDDITGNDLSERELQELESMRDEMMTPQIIIPDEHGIHHKVKVNKSRKYKPRKIISKDLRAAVYELHESRCHRCSTDNANQIHHIDGNPSNNHIRNLQLLCYDCHLIIEGKERFSITG